MHLDHVGGQPTQRVHGIALVVEDHVRGIEVHPEPRTVDLLEHLEQATFFVVAAERDAEVSPHALLVVLPIEVEAHVCDQLRAVQRAVNLGYWAED